MPLPLLPQRLQQRQEGQRVRAAAPGAASEAALLHRAMVQTRRVAAPRTLRRRTGGALSLILMLMRASGRRQASQC
jgi:hypothetical protein